MRLVVGVLSFLVVSLLPALTNAAPILVNGSFEQGPDIPTADINIIGGSTAIAGWTVTGNRIDYLGPPWDVSDGVRAIDLDGNGGTGGIEQAFATVSGQRYIVSFDLSGNPKGGPVVKDLRVTGGGFTRDYAFDTSGQTRENLIWHTIVFSFVASGATSILSFASLSPEGSSYGALIDNVRVTAPEPATWLLLGVGLAVALARGRSRPWPSADEESAGICCEASQHRAGRASR